MEDTKSKVLIFGSGFVPTALSYELSAEFSILRCSQYAPILGTGTKTIRYRDGLQEIKDHISSIGLIIIAVGTGDMDFCESKPNDALKQHLLPVTQISQSLANFNNLNCRVVLISTDNVFAAPKNLKIEAGYQDVPMPRTTYGNVKLECEKIFASSIGGTIFRLPAMVYNKVHPKNPISKIESFLSSREEIELDHRLIPRYFTSLSCVANFFINIEEYNEHSKVLHFSTDYGCTYLELTNKIAERMELNKEHVRIKIFDKDVASRSHIKLLSNISEIKVKNIDEVLNEYFKTE